MNKYQQILMKESNGRYFFTQAGKEVGGDVKVLSDDGFTLVQNEDITLTDYKLSIRNSCIEEVYAVKNNDCTAFTIIEGKETMFTYPISFEDEIDGVRIVFKSNLADTLIIPVTYKKADKEKYYAKKAEDDRKAIIARAQVKHATGADLVNIYFQPCSDDYFSTTIILYQGNMLMAKYKIDPEVFFKSISGLAYGEYSYEVIQYDKDGKELMRTDKIRFSISRPNYGGKPVVRI